MKLSPTIHGVIRRRVLVNFRVHPEVVRGLVSSYFRLKLVRGWAMAGICLIRLEEIRPRGFPAAWGLSSENAAHRIAVEWDFNGVKREGVFVPRRDTSSRLQFLAGGRLFPGIQHYADFEIEESANEFQLRMRSRDGTATLAVRAKPAATFPANSIFQSLTEASQFFERGSAGYSATPNPNCCEGMELCTRHWKVEPMAVDTVESSYFDDPDRFPRGSVHFDCALLMRNIQHEWRALPRMEGRP